MSGMFEVLFVGGPVNGQKRELPSLNMRFIDGVKYVLRSYFEVTKDGAKYKKGVMVAEGTTDEEAIKFLKEEGHMIRINTDPC